MQLGAQWAPMGQVVPHVGFRHRGKERTPDDPCTFRTPEHNRCIPSDVLAWQKHTEQWIAALARRADTRERNEIVDNLFRRYAVFSKSAAECGIVPGGLLCTAPTNGFVSTSQLARGYLLDWNEDVGPDEIMRDQGRNPINLPVPQEVQELADSLPSLRQWWDTLRNRVEAHAREHFFEQYLPFFILAALVLMAGQDARKWWRA